MVDPGRLTLDNFFDYIRAIKDEIKQQNEARMGPEERMLEAAKRSIDEMLERSGGQDDEEFIVEDESPQDDAGQAALLQMFGMNGPTSQPASPDRVSNSVLQQLASGYGR